MMKMKSMILFVGADGVEGFLIMGKRIAGIQLNWMKSAENKLFFD